MDNLTKLRRQLIILAWLDWRPFGYRTESVKALMRRIQRMKG